MFGQGEGMKVRESQGTSFNKLAGNPVQNPHCDHGKSWKSTGKIHMKKVWKLCLHKGILINAIQHVPEYLSTSHIKHVQGP